MLCLDVDGTGFTALGEHDRVVRALQRRFPGLRPVLFYTPYEAAAWTIISQRIRMTQAATIKARLGNELGEHGAFPAPARLAQLSAPQPGLTTRKIDQLQTLAAAAEDGALSRQRLRAMTYQDGLAHLQQLPGIGPFSAELILIRGVGHPDALPDHDTRLNERSAPPTTQPTTPRSTDHRRLAPLPSLGGAPAQSMARGRDKRDHPRPAQHHTPATPRHDMSEGAQLDFRVAGAGPAAHRERKALVPRRRRLFEPIVVSARSTRCRDFCLTASASCPIGGAARCRSSLIRSAAVLVTTTVSEPRLWPGGQRHTRRADAELVPCSGVPRCLGCARCSLWS